MVSITAMPSYGKDRIGLKIRLVAQTKSKGEPVHLYQLSDALGRMRTLVAARAANDAWSKPLPPSWMGRGRSRLTPLQPR